MTVTVNEMKPKLHTLDHLYTALGNTEPLTTVDFQVGEDVRFHVEPGWQHGVDAKPGDEPVPATIAVGRGAAATEMPLTKDAFLEATAISGLRKGFAPYYPADLLEGHLNFWFQGGLAARCAGTRSFQLLSTAGRVAAITKATVAPFSNLRLLDELIAGIHDKFGAGAEILGDYKFTHTLHRTHVRLVIPTAGRAIQGTGIDLDEWSLGIQMRNSLTGADRTSVDGYLFRWTCTNGATDTRATSGVWSRRGGNEADVYEWARAAVDDVLGGLESSLDHIQAMVDIPIHGQANDVLRDLFEHYKVALPERAKIIENLVEHEGALTMYSVMAAITEVANDVSMDAAHVDNLLRMGGDLPYAASSRCDACRRLLPH